MKLKNKINPKNRIKIAKGRKCEERNKVNLRNPAKNETSRGYLKCLCLEQDCCTKNKHEQIIQ